MRFFLKALAVLSMWSPAGLQAQGWSRFLAAPDSVHALAVVRSAQASRTCGEAAPLPISDEDLYRVLDLMVRGNVWAFRVALTVSDCLDGGALEDYLKAGGQLFDSQPIAFLVAAQQAGLSPSDFKEMVLMTPESLVDNFAGQARLLRRRAEILTAMGRYSAGGLISKLNEEVRTIEAVRP